jgi:hypothetical protein
MTEVMELEWGHGGGESPPVGQYQNCDFLGVELVPASEKDGKAMEEGVRFRFRVTEGDHKDKVATAIGPVKPTEKNRTGRLLKSMGVTAQAGTKTSIKDLIGRKFNLVVGLSQGGKPVVEYAFPVK